MSKEEVRLGFGDKFQPKSIEIAPGDPTPWDPSQKFRILGTRVPRLDGQAKVTGEARYGIDVRLPGMLYGKILRCPLPAATVSTIDVSAARRAPGVRAALALVKPGDSLRFAGAEIAAVAAESPEAAEDALAAIRVSYTPRAFTVDPAAARKAEAPPVFEGGEAKTRTSAGDMPSGRKPLPRKGNVQGPRATTRGDVEAGFRQAAAIVEGTYVTQVQTHSALETHGLAAQWDGDELTVWASTQGISGVRDELARELAIPASKVRVHCQYMGGGFGAKFGARAEGLAAARLAREAGRPVKLFLDRREEQLATGNRPASVQEIKLGATADGKLCALQLLVHGNGGTNGNTGTSAPAKNIYGCENLKTEEYDVFTNAGPSTAMRAPGHPQGAFALEAAMDELAAKLKMDPLEFRIQNDPSEVRRAEFRLGAERIGWKGRDARRDTKDPAVKRGVGVGAAVWYNGSDLGYRCTVTIHPDGSAAVEHGLQDLGTGSRTMVGIVAAEELGLPLERVAVRIGDTALPPGPESGGSGTTLGSAPTVRAAAYHARQKVAEAVAGKWKVPADQIAWAEGSFSAKSDPSKHATWAEACGMLPESGVTASADRAPDHEDAWKRFTNGAQFVEVAVDVETGQVRVEKVVAVHDCGVVVNSLTAESQVQGGVLQGISYALYENRVLDRPTGKMVNPNLEQYKILGSRDVPEIQVVFVNVWDGVNNTHSVGIGEPSTVPTAAAVANAVSHAVGARVTRLPITPEVVLDAVDRARGGRA
ncbi:MAG TPA: xanthine dehydrogenase family protein molybdopterin-binding subunit [Thermoanaerobaculia bacterium]